MRVSGNKIGCIVFVGLMVSSLAFADQVYLTNGEVLAGKIHGIDKVNKALRIELVVDNQLTGVAMDIRKDDMFYILRTGEFDNLQCQEVSEEDKSKVMKDYKDRVKAKGDIDYRIKQRTAKRKYEEEKIDRRRDYEEQQEAYREHQKDMEEMQHENRKDLIDFSTDQGVDPNVSIYDWN